jgi:hypothetical protein
MMEIWTGSGRKRLWNSGGTIPAIDWKNSHLKARESQCSSVDSNPAPPEYKYTVLISLTPKPSIWLRKLLHTLLLLLLLLL